ncbi:biotin carboxylase [Rhodoligotrophos appendicifer]|uniref:ATP-binding protein n=1 Tax=Rhodoligotrophos appendicifer TaxID=987056 RepID=UPI001185427B|nr:hypothetical protein [Rhodoligotrophos appendicifer]
MQHTLTLQPAAPVDALRTSRDALPIEISNATPRWREGEGGTILILGNYRPALTASRALSALGYRVAVTGNPAQPFAEFSRHVSEVWECPALVPGDREVIASLLGFIDSHSDLVAIMPVSEAALDLLVSCWSEVTTRGIRLAMPPAPVVRQCHDKTGMLDIAQRAGLDCPSYAVARDVSELEAVAIEVGFPLVIRPLTPGSRIGKLKAITLDRLEDLRTQPAGIFDTIGPMLLQRYFTGKRYNVYFASLEGRVLDEQHARIFRTDRADGSGLTVEGETIPTVTELSEDVHRLSQALGYTGVGCAQFLLDEGNRTRCFLEINPRFGANYSFIEAAGMPLTRLGLMLAGSDPVAPRGVPKGARRRVHFVWTYGDFAGLVHEILHRNIAPGAALSWALKALKAALTADMHVTWSWRDPKPTLMTYGGRFMRWMKPQRS